MEAGGMMSDLIFGALLVLAVCLSVLLGVGLLVAATVLS